MGLPLIIAGAAAVGAVSGMLGKGQQIDSNIRGLNQSADIAERNGKRAKAGFYGQANRFRMMSDLEQTRLARNHAQKIGQMKSGIGGSGAMADTGTTWDIVAAQDAENQREMNSYKTQSDFKVQGFLDQGDAQYDNYMNQAKALRSNARYMQSNKWKSMLFAGLSGGASGASTGASLYGADVGKSWGSVG